MEKSHSHHEKALAKQEKKAQRLAADVIRLAAKGKMDEPVSLKTTSRFVPRPRINAKYAQPAGFQIARANEILAEQGEALKIKSELVSKDVEYVNSIGLKESVTLSHLEHKIIAVDESSPEAQVPVRVEN